MTFLVLSKVLTVHKDSVTLITFKGFLCSVS